MSQIIIITDTEEPGACYRESSIAVLNLDTDLVYRMNVLTTDLKEKNPDFSELRLWGSYAKYYSDISADHLLDALEAIAKTEELKANPRITPSVVEEIRVLHDQNGSFKWPADIEFNLRDLLNMTTKDYGEEPSDEDPEPMNVDIEEIVAEAVDFRCAAYSGGQQVYSKHIPYLWALDE